MKNAVMKNARKRIAALPRPLAVALCLFVAACVGGQVADHLASTDTEWREHQGSVDDWWDARGLVVPHGTFPANCRLCHVAGTWSEMREDFTFDHLAETGVPLEGAHAAAQCLRCHNDRGPAREFTARGCSGCHIDVHLGQRGATCQNCHSQDDWRVGEFVLTHALSRFPLLGPHAAATCRQCHVGIDGGVMEPLDTDCASCHSDDLARATDPDHVGLGWTAHCEECHIVTSSFSGIGFTHTAFALVGGHAGLDCTACHAGGEFSGTPRMCADCHIEDYRAATQPDHQALGLPTSCQDCHRVSSWQGALFDHSSWALTGAHASSTCSACHSTGVYSGTPTNCVECHIAEYRATTDPDHEVLGFPTQCQQCHGTAAWAGAAFDHSSWALTGAHASTTCVSCHAGGVFGGTATDCFSCHEAEYNATTDPDHAALGFPISCQECHGTATWTGATFDHSSWELTGAHTTATCMECHKGGVYTGTPTDCFACHEAEYNATTDPDHAAIGFPTSCQDCHGTTMWTGAMFDHIWFPIVGGDHGGFTCTECHQVPGNTSQFSCTHCHEHRQTEMAYEHQGVSGYVWLSAECYQCHPNGQEHASATRGTPKRRKVRDAKRTRKPDQVPLRR